MSYIKKIFFFDKGFRKEYSFKINSFFLIYIASHSTIKKIIKKSNEKEFGKVIKITEKKWFALS